MWWRHEVETYTVETYTVMEYSLYMPAFWIFFCSFFSFLVEVGGIFHSCPGQWRSTDRATRVVALGAKFLGGEKFHHYYVISSKLHHYYVISSKLHQYFLKIQYMCLGGRDSRNANSPLVRECNTCLAPGAGNPRYAAGPRQQFTSLCHCTWSNNNRLHIYIYIYICIYL